MFDCLNSIKVPSEYYSNIQRIINMEVKKFTNLKSHDCHVLMKQLLSVALRGILLENVRLTSSSHVRSSVQFHRRQSTRTI